jgi:hypothetical protein
MNLPSDVARCNGQQEPICDDCQRRTQIALDAPGDYPYIAPVPRWDYCEQYIPDGISVQSAAKSPDARQTETE